MNSLVMRSSVNSTELTRLWSIQPTISEKMVSALGLVLGVALATRQRKKREYLPN